MQVVINSERGNLSLNELALEAADESIEIVDEHGTQCGYLAVQARRDYMGYDVPAELMAEVRADISKYPKRAAKKTPGVTTADAMAYLNSLPSEARE